jgi:hypothetical protein
MTEWAKVRRWVECVNQCRADEAFVWREIFQLTMYEREEFFFERRFTQTRIVANGCNSVVHFFFKETERDFFLGAEVIEDSAFGDAGFASNCFGSGGSEAFCLKQSEG